MRRILGVLILAAAFPAWAETMYVTDRFSVPLRAAFAEGSPVVKNVDSGAALEVLERADKYARVRDVQGIEGWIEARYLANSPSARPQLERAQAEAARLQRELAEAQAKLKQLDATLAQESARGAELSKAVEEARAEGAAQTAAATTVDDDFDFSWGWLVLAFAMLWLGFGAGVMWVRERHRKRLGGMYLRI
jgi:SH3 domain protein